MAEIGLAGRGRVELVPGNPSIWPGPAVAVRTDHPVAACMASQHAGWQISVGKYFAMGSGPGAQAAAGIEELFDKIGHREQSDEVVGVLEARKLPPAEVFELIAEPRCGAVDRVTLLVAPTASQCGGLQIAARSVETTLLKLSSWVSICIRSRAAGVWLRCHRLRPTTWPPSAALTTPSSMAVK